MRASIILTPALVVVMLQISGCANTPAKSPALPPPGGIYRSESAGALFEQAVRLNNPVENQSPNIAHFTTKGAHRPRFKPDTIYVAASAQGYVVSADDGQSWRRVSVPLASVLDVVALENNIVVVTGIDGSGQGYILRSADDGKSWQTVLTVPIPAARRSVPRIGIGNRSPVATVVISIAPDPFDSNRLYAGTSLGNIFVGEQFAKTWRKIHTVDSFALSNNQQEFAVADLIPSPHKAGDLMIITAGSRLYYIDATGAQKEIKIPQSKTVISAMFIPQYPDALIAGINDGATISRDRGITWHQLSLPVDTIKRFNTVVVRVSPTNPNRILVAINDAVYRSEDAGETWNTFSFNLANHVITDLLIHPLHAATVLALTTPLNS